MVGHFTGDYTQLIKRRLSKVKRKDGLIEEQDDDDEIPR